MISLNSHRIFRMGCTCWIALQCFSIHAIATQGKQDLTDLAALSIQDRSIQKLTSLLNTYRGTAKEPLLLYRLSDLYLQRSGITFRITEGASVLKGTNQYKTSLEKGVNTLSRLIQRYPQYKSIASAHFKRGKALKELKKTKAAQNDFEFLVNHHPKFAYLDSALMDLADFAQEDNAHQRALGFLKKIEALESEYYPIALHKSAWSYYNLELMGPALTYLEKEIHFYHDRAEKKKTRSSDLAFLESAFNDLALFSFEALNKKSPQESLSTLTDRFRKLDRNDTYFGKTVLKFAKLMKAYSLMQPLKALSDFLIQKHVELPETIEVILVRFQYHFEHQEFSHLVPIIAELKQVKPNLESPELHDRLESTLSGVLAELHQLVLKNKKSTEIDTLFRPLTSLTEAVETLFSENSSMSILARYALAESAYEIKKYSVATQLYGDMIALTPFNEQTKNLLEKKQISKRTLSLLRLGSRYQELKVAHLIPDALKSTSLDTPVSALPESQQRSLSEWTQWIDELAQKDPSTFTPEHTQTLISFQFESARLMYEYLDRKKAIERLSELSLKHSETPDGQHGISLVLDTLSQSQLWKQTYQLTELASTRNWKDPEFLKKSHQLSAQAHFKVTQDSASDEITLARSQECAKKYADLDTGKACQRVALKTLISLNQLDSAIQELNSGLAVQKTKADSKDSDHKKALLLLRAEAYRKQGKTAQSMNDLFEYQELTEYADAEISQSILRHFWFKRDEKKLTQLLKNKKVCSKAEKICDRFRLVSMLETQTENSISYKTAFQNTIHSPKELRALWALIALRSPEQTPFQDKLVLLHRIGQYWNDLDPLVQVNLYPILINRVSNTESSILKTASAIAPLSEDESSIERRMHLMQQLDNSFAKVMTLDWLAIKVQTFYHLEQIYQQLVADLKAIHTPADLLQPFESKVQDIKTALATLQEKNMKFAISDRKPAQNHELLSSNEILSTIPREFLVDWKQAVQTQHKDTLFHLIATIEQVAPSFQPLASIARGLTLLLGNADAEAYQMIMTSPDSPWKSTLIARFKPGVQP